MIYNREANFLFVHIQKNAGTAISEALRQIPGSHLIQPAHLRLADVALAQTCRPFVFAVSRNPWSRLVSWYEMMLRKGVHNDFSRYLLTPQPGARGPVTFSDFIRRTAVVDETNPAELGHAQRRPGAPAGPVPRYRKSLAFNQLDYLVDRTGRLSCDFVLRFERIDEDWPELVRRLVGDAQPVPLRRVNHNPSPGDWRDRYRDPRDIDWVAALYARDIAAFGHDFGEA